MRWGEILLAVVPAIAGGMAIVGVVALWRKLRDWLGPKDE